MKRITPRPAHLEKILAGKTSAQQAAKEIYDALAKSDLSMGNEYDLFDIYKDPKFQALSEMQQTGEHNDKDDVLALAGAFNGDTIERLKLQFKSMADGKITVGDRKLGEQFHALVEELDELLYKDRELMTKDVHDLMSRHISELRLLSNKGLASGLFTDGNALSRPSASR